MSTNFCSREDELLDALGRGFLGAELEAHVAGCEPCTELQLVAGALLEERTEAIREAAVPGAGTMWWRMQLRHRQDAQKAARHSLLIGQAASLVIALVLAGAIFGPPLVAGLREVVADIRFSTPLLFAVATWLLAVPIAGYIALRQK